MAKVPISGLQIQTRAFYTSYEVEAPFGLVLMWSRRFPIDDIIRNDKVTYRSFALEPDRGSSFFFRLPPIGAHVSSSATINAARDGWASLTLQCTHDLSVCGRRTAATSSSRRPCSLPCATSAFAHQKPSTNSDRMVVEDRRLRKRTSLSAGWTTTTGCRYDRFT